MLISLKICEPIVNKFSNDYLLYISSLMCYMFSFIIVIERHAYQGVILGKVSMTQFLAPTIYFVSFILSKNRVCIHIWLNDLLSLLI